MPGAPHEDGCAEAPCSNCEYLRGENERLQQWVHDCQAGMYINCVYCGHRYGPDDEVPATMADVLKEHIMVCPKHPLSAAIAERDSLQRRVLYLEDHGKGRHED